MNGMSSDPVRSRMRSSHRHMRDSTVWLAFSAGRLLRLGEQHLLVADQDAAQRLEFVGQPSPEPKVAASLAT
jgi:hypothetical protein